MSRFFATLLAMLLTLSASGQPAVQPNTYRTLLRTLEYAEVFRISINKTCIALPEAKLSDPFSKLCRMTSTIPNETIERVAEPYIRRYVSQSEALEAIEFWSSPSGVQIESKILQELRENSRILTEDELRTLDQVNKSSFGVALSHLAKDTNASITIIREVAANVP